MSGPEKLKSVKVEDGSEAEAIKEAEKGLSDLSRENHKEIDRRLKALEERIPGDDEVNQSSQEIQDRLEALKEKISKDYNWLEMLELYGKFGNKDGEAGLANLIDRNDKYPLNA